MADTSASRPGLRCPVCGSSGDDNWQSETGTVPLTPTNQWTQAFPMRIVRCLACDYLLFFARDESAQL
jgi:hypothetical protein